MPDGLSINPSNGKISGKPTEYGEFNVTVTVANDYEKASTTFTLTIKNAKPVITTKTLEAGTVGENYSATLTATHEPEKWSWSGKKPAGLELSDDGIISGTPTKEGNYNIKVTAQNSAGKSSAKTLKLKINKAVNLEQSTPYYFDGSVNSDIQATAESTQENLFTANPENVVKNFDFVNSNVQTSTNDFKNINGKNYLVVAQLPAISVEKSGQYEIKVKLDENAVVGKKLIWFASPVNSESSDDDNIADFYSYDGEPVSTVPENHLITIDAWLNAEILYEPVLAIEVD